MEIYVVKYKNRKEKAIHQFQNTDYGVRGREMLQRGGFK